jgi:hypothetical protein
MKMIKKLIVLTGLVSSTLFAQVKTDVEVPYISYEIKMGKGFDAVNANCLMCHSFGYIINQGPQSRKFWDEKINKMIVHFKAPIEKEAHETVLNYLYKHYGNGKLK